jgi:predicted DNA-binding transcriptional regulator
MVGSERTVSTQWVSRGRGAEEERLDRALVTGLMLEVILETSSLKGDPRLHRSLVKTRLKSIMVTYLAGRVTLQRFRNLLREVDHCFPHYYSLIASGSHPGPTPTVARPPEVPPPAASAPPVHRVLREDLLKDWLETEIRKFLPQRPHRKLGVERLLDFLLRTQGSWFRLRDFERHFEIDRKTAWEYLQKFLSAGLLCHNHQRSAAVRYALATRFLVVLADALRPKVREALPHLPQSQTDQVCDWLVATGGELFEEAEWHVHHKPAQCRHLLGSLKAAGLLEGTDPAGSDRIFQLPRVWLQN